MALRGVDNPKQTRDAEAFMRIANCIAAELPGITDPHWHEALESIRRHLTNSAACYGRPTFGLVDGEEA